MIQFFFFQFFLFNVTATTEIYTLSLHDALPIYAVFAEYELSEAQLRDFIATSATAPTAGVAPTSLDRKSTRLNSSHVEISYAVFCLKKKKTIEKEMQVPCHKSCFRSVQWAEYNS